MTFKHHAFRRVLALSGLLTALLTPQVVVGAVPQEVLSSPLQARQDNNNNNNNNQLCLTSRYENKTRVFILTDISNEPDDQMSLVRLLTYANELDIAHIATVTSTWKNDSIDTASVFHVLDGYRQVVPSLDSNVPLPAGAYPPADDLAARVVTGHAVYGLAALDEPVPSNASTALVAAVDDAAEDAPLWVCAWGGANVLAEALDQVRRERTDDEVASFVRKLRVYSISDQDDAGAWIRTNFPTLFYIVSVHGFSEYGEATWNGISGELYRHFDKGGPDHSLVTNEWLQQHIRIGPLGQHYLNWTYIMEGDTPSFLSLLPTGLATPEHPEWGGWGGRYMLADASGAQALYADASDFALGANNDTFLSGHASIWRWREAYQNDFAARMQWTVSPGGDNNDNNHQPVAVVNGSCATLEIPYSLGDSVVLDASQSWDPDGDDLSFDWFHYREPTFRLEGDIPRISPNVTLDLLDALGAVVSVTPNDNETMHIILTVRDNRSMALANYRRVILFPTS